MHGLIFSESRPSTYIEIALLGGKVTFFYFHCRYFRFVQNCYISVNTFRLSFRNRSKGGEMIVFYQKGGEKAVRS